jgi:hypothetical protein
MASTRASKRSISDRPDDPRHGTVNGYNNLKCRCQACRAAWGARTKLRRAARTLSPDDPRHGKVTTYWNYSCRCPACTEAHRRCKAEQYQRARFERLVDTCARAGIHISRDADGHWQVILDESLRPGGTA